MATSTEMGAFAGLQLHPLTCLQANPDRVVCSVCQKSRRYYCAECVKLLVSDAPIVKLPLRVEILQASAEVPQRSTAQHVSLLSTEDAKVWRPFPDCMEEFEENVLRKCPTGTAAILYPCDDALTPEEAVEQLPNLSTLIVIDAKWHKSVSMSQHAAFQGLPQVKLSPPAPGSQRMSHFWRYSPKKGDGSAIFNADAVKGLLATVEAIHCFVTGYGVAKGVGMPGDYDNLLWLFVHNHSLVKRVYDAAPGKRERIMRKSKGLLADF
jgi:DTW domain-containing protein YfiP